MSYDLIEWGRRKILDQKGEPTLIKTASIAAERRLPWKT